MNIGLTEEDYYLDESERMVFTEAYHLGRGYCCKSGCRHCPYGFSGSPTSAKGLSKFILC
ncbi:MAG: DUF5522 domain-containing protein [Cytophagaceae bacterium]|nr:DUF5522 domain-containing protein [Cytophagaceae bacterium]